jgi:uncharacterized protein YndB with AHSA1/START domain
MAERPLYTAQASVEIAAAPEAVFDAWLDPTIAAQFLAAGETEVAEMEMDPREGGRFRLVMQGANTRFEHDGRYVLIDRPKRLIFTWISEGTDRRLSLVTVTFTPIAAGVRVHVEHEGLPDAERAGRHEYGWGTIVMKLARLTSAEEGAAQ